MHEFTYRDSTAPGEIFLSSSNDSDIYRISLQNLHYPIRGANLALQLTPHVVETASTPYNMQGNMPDHWLDIDILKLQTHAFLQMPEPVRSVAAVYIYDHQPLIEISTS